MIVFVTRCLFFTKVLDRLRRPISFCVFYVQYLYARLKRVAKGDRVAAHRVCPVPRNHLCVGPSPKKQLGFMAKTQKIKV